LKNKIKAAGGIVIQGKKILFIKKKIKKKKYCTQRNL
jgi:hypothetical protein